MRLSMHDWRLPVLALAGLAFALLSGGRLPFYLFYITTGLLLTGYLWSWYVLNRLKGSVTIDRDRLEVGQALSVSVGLQNGAFLPLPWAEVDENTPKHLVITDDPRQATSIPVKGRQLVHFRLTAKRRGYYPVGPIRITAGDPLGLFRGSQQLYSPSAITVYPRLRQIERMPIPLAQPFGPIRTWDRAFEDPSNQAELREYRPGDNPRQVHWKTSARMGQLMTREYELNATTPLLLFPDMCAESQTGSADKGPSTLEMIIELTASMAELGLRSKMSVGLICHDQERSTVPQGVGHRTFHEIMERLARLEGTGQVPMEKVLETEAVHLTGKATLVVITANLTPGLTRALIQLRARHQVMLLLLDPHSFSDARPPVNLELARALHAHKVHVYLLSADDDIQRLPAYRLTSDVEGVSAWPSSDRLASIRSASRS